MNDFMQVCKVMIYNLWCKYRLVNLLQMFGAMFGAAMFGDGDEDDMNEFFMGKLVTCNSNFLDVVFDLWPLRDGIRTIRNVL